MPANAQQNRGRMEDGLHRRIVVLETGAAEMRLTAGWMEDRPLDTANNSNSYVAGDDHEAHRNCRRFISRGPKKKGGEGRHHEQSPKVVFGTRGDNYDGAER